MKLSGNTIFIVGGTSGIGRGLAEALHQRGNRVIVGGRRQALLDELTAQHPGMEGVAIDLQDSGSIESAAAKVKQDFPALNVLMVNAGIARFEDLTTGPYDLSSAREIVQTNILGVMETVGAFLPLLREQPQATVMATTSNLAFMPMAAGATYSASKAFLHSWLQSLRFQLRQTKVEVLELAPPYVQTELGGEQQKSDPRAMPLDEYIAEVMTLLENPNPPRGEVIVQRQSELRTAEREGRYEEVYAALNTMF